MAKFYFFEKAVQLFYDKVFTKPKETYGKPTQLGITFASGQTQLNWLLLLHSGRLVLGLGCMQGGGWVGRERVNTVAAFGFSLCVRID